MAGMWHAYKEVWPLLLRQLKYEDFYLKRELPPMAERRPAFPAFSPYGIGEMKWQIG
jgi:hypothetical protein